jgi:two-component system phosphate regulon sensor histidine kinase PhoR
MRIASPKLIAFLAGFALVGLSVIQYYWIKGAIDQKHEHFEQDVREALMQVSRKYNRHLASLRMSKMMPHHSQMAHHEPHFGTELKFAKNPVPGNGNFSLKITNSTGDSVSFESTAKTAGMLSRVSSVLFDHLVRMNLYGDHMTAVDTILVDSLLRNELVSRGISTHYTYAILNTPVCVFNSDGSSGSAESDSLLCSKYRVRLTPDDFFAQPRVLSIYFPNEKAFILRSTWGMLSVSVLFILFIIFLFYYSINTIYRQKKLGEIKNDFISNMTHELKTPISTISLACEVLGDDSIEKTPERTHRYISMIKDENKRLGILVENVLQTAILDKGNFKLKPVQVDLHDMIMKSVDGIQLAVDKKEGKITTDLQATRFVIHADKTHLQNVIYNLLDNALKYTPGQPILQIATHNHGDGVVFKVKDNGVGIHRDNHKKIFEKLYRVPTGNIHDVKGYGLGLNYVKAIVEKHGGQVWLESELNNGSRFFVYLPTHPTHQ